MKIPFFRRIGNGIVKAARSVKAVVIAGGVAVVALVATAPQAKAQSFDYTVYASTFTSGATAVAAAATLMAGILAGVTVWKKLHKYFVKGG